MNTYQFVGQSAHCTHPSLHIRSAADAHRVFEAVRVGILPLIRRRLSPSERDLLSSGQVFVWEEASSVTHLHDDGTTTTSSVSGLERWTDGRRWSQSRMREPFLFYEEKVQTTPEEKQAKAERRARKNTGPTAAPSPSVNFSASYVDNPLRRQDRPSKPGGLTKQTYSSYVQVTPHSPPKKWHCVAYFLSAEYNALPVVESYPYLQDLVIPEAVYTSAKGAGTGAGRHAAPPMPPMSMTPVPTPAAMPTMSRRQTSPYGRRPPRSAGSISSASASGGEDFGRANHARGQIAHILNQQLPPQQQQQTYAFPHSSASSTSGSGSRSPSTPGSAWVEMFPGHVRTASQSYQQQPPSSSLNLLTQEQLSPSIAIAPLVRRTKDMDYDMKMNGQDPELEQYYLHINRQERHPYPFTFDGGFPGSLETYARLPPPPLVGLGRTTEDLKALRAFKVSL